MQRLRKAVFPAAGWGTRFLPATKASPKEMLPIVDKPLIQYGVEEAVAAGMDEIIMVTGKGKRAIEDHFDASPELEALLTSGKQKTLAGTLARISNMADIVYVRQKRPLGLGHAVQCAAKWIGNECFGVVLADELIAGDVPAMQQLRRVHEATGASVVGLARIPRELSSRYGIVSAIAEGDFLRLNALVEKPSPKDAPSDLAIVGRYIFTPTIFQYLERLEAGNQGELQLTDAIHELAQEEPVYGVVLQGKRYDAGNPLGFLMANVAFGMRHPEIAEPLRAFLKRFA